MRTIRTMTCALIGAVVLATTACGFTGTGARESRARPTALVHTPSDYSRSDRITASELEGLAGTAADAVRRLRPEFLRGPEVTTDLSGAPGSPSVYVNGRYSGDASVLRLIPLRIVTEIRHLDPVAAKSILGSYCDCNGGVILVRTER